MNDLATLARLVDGHEDALRVALERLPAGPGSPFSRVATVHFARWVVIPRMPGAGRGFGRPAPAAEFLLFSASFDGERDTFLEDLCAGMAEEADQIWSHCVGYPGAADQHAFRRWLLDGEIPARYVIAMYPDATVEDVHRSVALRRSVVDFALRAQDMDAAAALAAFRAEF